LVAGLLGRAYALHSFVTSAGLDSGAVSNGALASGIECVSS
jgi:hypothetical protein